MEQTDKTSLESAIKNEASLVIADIARKEAQELKRLDDAYAAELDEFKKMMADQTDARIRQESARLENRAGLDLRKLKLKSLEAFIGRVVDEAAGGIRNNPRYKQFLLDAVREAARQIPKGGEVRLASEDLALEKEIRDVIKAAAANTDMIIVLDKTIKWGGCIVVDRQGGRIFDSTLERICFRKSAVIRREVMKLLLDQFGNAGAGG